MIWPRHLGEYLLTSNLRAVTLFITRRWSNIHYREHDMVKVLGRVITDIELEGCNVVYYPMVVKYSL